MFFGLFGKSPKKPLEELKEILDFFKKIMDSNKKDKIILEKFTEASEKLNKCLLEEDKLNPTQSTKNDVLPPEKMSYFLKNKVTTVLIGYAINDSPEGVIDIIIKSITQLIKDLRSKHLLSDLKVVEAFISLMHSLENLINLDKLRYTTRILLINFLSELCKQFFVFPEMISLMKIKLNEGELQSEYDEILIFSLLLNIFKTDQLILEYENKKLIRRAIIICLSFEEVAESNYIENESLLCEILIEKLCNYYSMLPEYFELSEELLDVTLEVAPNMKKTFPVLVNTYLEFRDYIFFFNKLCNTIRSIKLKDKLKIILFNKFLLQNVQAKLFSHDIRIIRSNLQYFIFILKTMKNSEVVNLFFYFIFGFNDKTSRTGHMSKEVEQSLNLENNNEEVLKNSQFKKDKSNETLTTTTEDTYFNKYKIQDLDFDYSKHENISISLSLLNNLTNYKENINVVIITLFETFFEKCPYMTIHKVLLPFTEVCLKQMENTSYLLQNKKSYPNVDCFFSLLSKINDNKKFQFLEISDNLENNLNRSYTHYINNDVDFYYYYLNQREDQENFQYVVEGEGDGIKDNLIKIENENENVNENLCYCIDNDTFKSPEKMKETTQPNENEIYSDMRTSLARLPTKYNFDYFTTNTKQKINYKDKLFDELAEIEEEFNNIHICFMKSVLEKFVNFMNNSHIENLFFTNLIITILTVPCLEFDPVLVLCQSLLLDQEPNSNFSFYIHAKNIAQEIENKIIENKNYILFIKIRKEENEASDNETINDKKRKYSKDKNSTNSVNNNNNSKSNQNKINSNSSSLITNIISDFVKSLPTNLQKEYLSNLNTINNMIIFTEFIKELISIIIHKFHFENLVENLYELYSNMLDNYYINNENNEQEVIENVNNQINQNRDQNNDQNSDLNNDQK